MNLDKNKSTSTPLISVIMPVFNSEKYLVQAIESILYQTYFHFEFIILDDGSVDRSLDIIQSYADKDDRINVVVNKKNLGLGQSLNKGLTLAKGEFIARMDADDISFPHRLQKQLSFLLAHPEIMILGGNQVVIDPDGDQVSHLSFSNQPSVLRWNMLLGNGLIVSHPSVMIRRDFLLSIGGYSDLRAAQDFELWSRLFEKDFLPIHNLQDPILYYREHDQTITTANKSLQEETAVKIRKQNIEGLLGHPIADDVIRSYRHTGLHYENIKEYISTWLEIFQKFTYRFKLTNVDTAPIREELAQRISNYTYLNPFKPVLKGRISFWHMIQSLPLSLSLAVLKQKKKFLRRGLH